MYFQLPVVSGNENYKPAPFTRIAAKLILLLCLASANIGAISVEHA